MAFKFRKCFSVLRCGTAPFIIETGRYERLPVEQRVCEVCDSDNVEDEMHFLISCNAFIQERTKLFTHVSQFVSNFNELSLEDKFIVLMSNPNICTFTLWWYERKYMNIYMNIMPPRVRWYERKYINNYMNIMLPKEQWGFKNTNDLYLLYENICCQQSSYDINDMWNISHIWIYEYISARRVKIVCINI